MGKINIGRVLLGGLLAGLVVNIFEFVTNGVVLASQRDAGLKALGHQMPRSAPITFVTSTLARLARRRREWSLSWLPSSL